MHALIVAAVAVRHRANHTVTISEGRQAGQQLAQPNSGDGGRDGFVRPTNLLRGVGLGVQGVEMRTAAVLDDEYARPLRSLARTVWDVGLLGVQEFRKAQPKDADAADLEQAATA